MRPATIGDDTLEKIRHILRVKSRMVHFKNKNVRGQTSSTRSRAVIDRIQERAAHLAHYYRLVRAAKLSLSGPGQWEKQLQDLKDGDVRSYQDPNRLKKQHGRRGTIEDGQLETLVPSSGVGSATDSINLMPESRSRRDGTGEMTRTLSWIWLVERRDGKVEGLNDDENDDILRSEWAKSRARANRSSEEVMMVREEMRRLVEFLMWMARVWSERQSKRVVGDKALAEGLVAYAVEQAALQRRLCAAFQTLFKTPLQEMDNAAQELVDHDDDDEYAGNTDDGATFEEEEEGNGDHFEGGNVPLDSDDEYDD